MRSPGPAVSLFRKKKKMLLRLLLLLLHPPLQPGVAGQPRMPRHEVRTGAASPWQNRSSHRPVAAGDWMVRLPSAFEQKKLMILLVWLLA